MLTDPFFGDLKAFVIDATGLAFYYTRDAELAGHLARRMTATGTPDGRAYLALLRKSDAELDTLIGELTIGETYFFRYTEQFAALRDTVFPALLRKNRDSRRLRIWSAGCATGAEPYSLSILLRRDLAASFAGWDVSIVGTDINRDFLARAQQGLFGDWAFRGVPDTLRDACFTRQGDQWRIHEEYRRGVCFQYHNLVRHPFPSLVDGLVSFDLILCRNVFIYFAFERLQQMVRHFTHCLVADGWFLVGHAESNVELFRELRTVSVPGAILYQKAPTEVDVPYSAPVLEPAPAPEPLPVPSPPVDVETVRTLLDRADWDGAERACRQWLAVHDLDPQGHFHLALVLEHQGRRDAAERSLRQALYLDRKFAMAHYHLGLLLERRGDRAGATRSFQNARRLLADLPPGHLLSPSEGLTAANLQELTAMQLELL